MKEHTTQLKRIHEGKPEDSENYDLIFFGSACHSEDLGVPVKKFLDNLPKTPRFSLAGFFTHATFSEGEHLLKWAGKCVPSFESACRGKQIDFKGYYNCQGAPTPGIEEFIHREIITGEQEWEEYVEEVRKHPTPEDLLKAREFALEVLSKS